MTSQRQILGIKWFDHVRNTADQIGQIGYTWPTMWIMAQASEEGPGAACERSLDYSHRSVNMEVAMTLSWSCTAVSE